MSKFQIFSQPAQPVHWASLYRALILVILETKSYMAWAHKLQIGLGKYFGSILGLGLGSFQPTTNPYGFLVVKQGSKCGERSSPRDWRSVYGAGYQGWWGHFPELKEGKMKREVGGAGVLV